MGSRSGSVMTGRIARATLGSRSLPAARKRLQARRYEMTVTSSLAESARHQLSGLEQGITGPEDPGYDEARAVHNGMIDRRPGAIIVCSSAEDVARVIAFAREHDAPLAVRGGGHNGAGLGVVDEGVVIDLS